MTTRNTVLVAGSANLDFVVRAAHIPAPGETVLGREFATFPGGKGANQAVASARAGAAPTRMLLALGNDTFAAPIEASLRSAGVGLEIVRTDAPTGVAFICISDEAENAITVAPGANGLLRPGHLPDLAGVSHLLLQLETPLESSLAWARNARGHGAKVVLNAAPAQVLPSELLATIDLLIVNEGELEAITGVRGRIHSAIERLAVENVVVTLGARGCYVRVAGETLLQPSFAIDPVDSTGAGDTFCGALVAQLAHGAVSRDAVRFASAAAALACTRLGAQASVPLREEVERLLANGEERCTVAGLADYCGC